MNNNKLYVRINTFRELGKDNNIVDLEIISLNKIGLLPNIGFIIKAGNVSKNRKTNNLKQIELYDSKENFVSNYYLPFIASSYTQEFKDIVIPQCEIENILTIVDKKCFR